MRPLLARTWKVAVALAAEPFVVQAHRHGRIGLLFTCLSTLALTAFAWPWLAHLLGVVNTAVLLTLVYVFAAGPVWLARRLVPAAAPGPSFWKPKREPDPSFPERRRLRMQF